MVEHTELTLATNQGLYCINVLQLWQIVGEVQLQTLATPAIVKTSGLVTAAGNNFVISLGFCIIELLSSIIHKTYVINGHRLFAKGCKIYYEHTYYINLLFDTTLLGASGAQFVIYWRSYMLHDTAVSRCHLNISSSGAILQQILDTSGSKLGLLLLGGHTCTAFYGVGQ